MVPLGDESRRSSTFPIATIGLIVANVIVFIFELVLGDSFIAQFALVPNHVVHGQDLYTLFTSMFLHAGFLHIAGNMLFLAVFGPNMEDLMGARAFTIYYLVCGLIANLVQIGIDPGSTILVLGASGAIAGVLGGFIVEFPHDEIKSLIPVGNFFFATRVPAILLLGGWFLLQLVSGVGAITSLGQAASDVAFFAHIGGFIAGVVLVKPFVAFRPIARHYSL